MLRDSCAYVKEGLGAGKTRFCFKPSSMYTAECQDDNGASMGPSGVSGDERRVDIKGEKV